MEGGPGGQLHRGGRYAVPNQPQLGDMEEVGEGPNESRVNCTQAVTSMFTKKGFTVNVQEGAGKLSNLRDEDFTAAGANIIGK